MAKQYDTDGFWVMTSGSDFYPTGEAEITADGELLVPVMLRFSHFDDDGGDSGSITSVVERQLGLDVMLVIPGESVAAKELRARGLVHEPDIEEAVR